MALSSDNNYLATGSENGIITLRNLNDIIPMSYLVGRDVVQQPQTGIGADVVRQIEALRDEFRLLGSRFGAFLGSPICVQLNANPNQTSRGASVNLATVLKHRLLRYAFRLVPTASKATLATYTSHGYKIHTAPFQCNNRISQCFSKSPLLPS